MHLQERERLARSRESPQRTSSNGTRDNAAAHAEFEAAAAILRLQEEHRVNRTLHAAAVSTFPFMRLPAHVRAHVLSLLPASPLHLLRVRLVCRDLCAITHWNVLWHHLALDQWGIVDPQQRPRRGETWQAYYIETHRMLRKSDETFLRAAVERGLVRVVRDNLDRCFREHAVQHLCVAIQHSQPSIVHLLLPITPPALLANAPTGASSAVSPLRLAIRANRLEIVQCLLAAGASLDTPAILPPLHYAAQRGATPAMMQLLLQRSRSHDAVLAHAADGQTPLHHALAFGHVTCAEWLLARKATLEAVDARGRTPLVAAVRAGSVPGVEFAFQRGATLPQLAVSGGDTRSLLHEAAANGHARIVDLLVQHGADVESRDLMNNTPVFLAAFGGYAKVVQTLVQRDARIDVCNSDGCTPLHNAARSGSADTIKLLLRLGARADVEDCDGRTPSEYARALGHSHIVRLIDAYASSGAPSPALLSPRTTRTIGLLGGTDFELTALYFRLINMEMRTRSGGGSNVCASVLVASSEWSSTAGTPAMPPPAAAPSSPPVLTRRSSSAVAATSPVLSPRELGNATRLRDAALVLMSAGADVLCVADGSAPIDASTSVENLATTDERDVALPGEVNREGRAVVGRWSSLGRAVRVAACRSVVVVDRASPSESSGNWLSNALETMSRCGVADVASLCECTMARLRALLPLDDASQREVQLRELFRSLHARFDAIVLLDNAVYDIWCSASASSLAPTTTSAISCVQCSSNRCLLASGAAPISTSKDLVIDVTRAHAVAVCDAATLPSQQLSFQQNARF